MKETKVIAICNQKGGVGKTTTTANLGYVLGKMGHKVLLIDFDSQGSLSGYFGMYLKKGGEPYPGICELMEVEMGLKDEDSAPFFEMSEEELVNACIQRPTYNTRRSNPDKNSDEKFITVPVEFGVDLITSNLCLSDIELCFANNIRLKTPKVFVLSSVIERIRKYREYDYILIDCNPNLGIMTVNAITAALNGVIIPTNLDIISTRGVRSLIDAIVAVQESLKESKNMDHFGVIGVLLNLYRSDRVVDKTIQTDMERFYPFTIFKNTIPDSVKAKQAALAGVTFCQMLGKAEEAYIKLAKEVIKQIAIMEKEGPQIKQLGEDIQEEIMEVNRFGNEI